MSRLTDNEITALAYRISGDHLANVESWLEWENYPELGQFEFEDLVEKIQIVVNYLREARRLMESTWDIDTAALLERIQ